MLQKFDVKSTIPCAEKYVSFEIIVNNETQITKIRMPDDFAPADDTQFTKLINISTIVTGTEFNAKGQFTAVSSEQLKTNGRTGTSYPIRTVTFRDETNYPVRI